MVDSVSINPVSAGDRTIAAVTRVPAQTPVAGPVTKEQAAPTTTVAKQLAVAPPVDAERVQRIKRAIAEGTFPLSPSTIADQLIALRYDWMSHDAS